MTFIEFIIIIFIVIIIIVIIAVITVIRISAIVIVIAAVICRIVCRQVVYGIYLCRICRSRFRIIICKTVIFFTFFLFRSDIVVILPWCLYRLLNRLGILLLRLRGRFRFFLLSRTRIFSFRSSSRGV